MVTPCLRRSPPVCAAQARIPALADRAIQRAFRKLSRRKLGKGTRKSPPIRGQQRSASSHVDGGEGGLLDTHRGPGGGHGGGLDARRTVELPGGLNGGGPA